MRYVTIIWDDSPGENVEHVAHHGLTPDEVDSVLQDPSARIASSASTGNRVVFGYTNTGRYIMVAFKEIDALTILPLTAYDVPEPGA